MAVTRLPVRMTTEVDLCSILYYFLVTVSGATGSDLFRGVLLIAKRSSNDQIVGTWSTADGDFQTLNCGGVSSTGITHTSDSDKTQVTAGWTAPADLAQGDIVIRYANPFGIILYSCTWLFRATVVRTYDTYYVDCFRTTLTAAQVCPLTMLLR
jgi:hypothetical protein